MSHPPSGPTGASVLVVDGVRLTRDCLVTTLRREPTIGHAVGVAGGEGAVRLLHERRFTVVLVSMAGTGSRVMCRDVVGAAAPTPVIAYAVSCCDNEVLACAEAGVAGYLLQDQPQAELMNALAAAARGDVWCPSEVAAMLMRQMGPGGRTPGVPVPAARLTTREREILDLIDEGLSNKDIARKLSIEVRTVKNHVHNLLEKLQVHRRGEAAALLRRRTHASQS